MAKVGGPPAWRGFRLQGYYTIHRIAEPGLSQNLLFCPESVEDLAIQSETGDLIEVIQVKSYPTLTLSKLEPEKLDSFFRRVLTLFESGQDPLIRLVNFGTFGEEMLGAWAGIEQHRVNLHHKLSVKGYTDEEITLLLTNILLESFDEHQLQTQTIDYIRKGVAGYDPDHTFELFYAWIALASEKQAVITQPEIYDRLTTIGEFLSDCHSHQREWFTNIKPIRDYELLADHRARLQNEFYAGASARYEHILAGLDFQRPEKIQAIARGFEEEPIVIIHAASGEGKSTLGWRYLYEVGPGTLRFWIKVIRDRRHVLDILQALSSHAAAVQMPMLIYMDVAPQDTDWAELAKGIVRHPNLQVLVSIREEDFRRTTTQLRHKSVTLRFDKEEASKIYERALEAGHRPGFLNFEAAWGRFGERGPLLEFVYLLTQTQTLQENLTEQIYRLRNEVRLQLSETRRSETDLLRLVTVASTYGARLHLQRLRNLLDLPDFYRTLQLFDESYLIRLSGDNQFIEGLHPVRSRILAGLLTDPHGPSWLETTYEVLPLMVESDLEIFFLHAFVEHPVTSLPEILGNFQPITWSGVAGILRTWLWSIARDYVRQIEPLIQEAYELMGSGWWFLVKLDFTNITPARFDEWWKEFGNFFSKERQEAFSGILARQPSKENIFLPAFAWLAQLEKEKLSSITDSEWQAAAEVCFWGGYGNVRLDHLILDDALIQATREVPLDTLADFALSLYSCDPERCLTWLTDQRPVLEERLAIEYRIVAIETDDEAAKIHFLLIDEKTSQSDEDSTGKGSDPIHARTMERVNLIRRFYPNYKRYASQGYGHQLKSLNLPFDSTTKTGIDLSYFPTPWEKRINAVALGMGNYPFRLPTWADYVAHLINVRHRVVDALKPLRKGLIRFLQSTKAVNLYEKYVQYEDWKNCRKELETIHLLPQQAVDPWGFCREISEDSGTIGAIQSKVVVSWSTALYSYNHFLRAEKGYIGSLLAFFGQAPNVIWTNSEVGKLHTSDIRRKARLENLEKIGIQTDMGQLSNDNLVTAVAHLQEYQRSFRSLFSEWVDRADLDLLEIYERELLEEIKWYWYFFAYKPFQAWSRPETQIPNKINIEKNILLNRIQAVMDKMTNKDVKVTLISQSLAWSGESAFWFQVDVSDVLQLGEDIDNLIAGLRRALTPVDYKSLRHYWTKDFWKHTVIIPTVRGKLLDRKVWGLTTSTTILSEGSSEEKIFLYLPSEIAPDVLDALGMEIWEIKGAEVAEPFATAVSELWFFVSRLAELIIIPETTEAGAQVIQTFIDEQFIEIDHRLELIAETINRMRAEAHTLSTDELQNRLNLVQVIEGLDEIIPFLLPSREENAHIVLVKDIPEYAQRLTQASLISQLIKYYWIRDALAQTSNRT